MSMTRDGKAEKPDYGFGASLYITCGLTAIGVVFATFAVISTVMELSTWILILCWTLAGVGFIAAFFWRILSGIPTDPKRLEHFHRDFVGHLATIWNGQGKILDLGTGSGRAAIEIAKKFPDAQIVGMDLWHKKWRFFGISKEQAEANARIESVDERCTFQHGNILDMPFEDGEFQLVVSSMVFHEIRIPDRTELFREILRVLSPGGIFMICDIFRSVKGYRVGDISQLVRKIEKLGAENVGYRSLEEAGLDIGSLVWFWKAGYLHGSKPAATG